VTACPSCGHVYRCTCGCQACPVCMESLTRSLVSGAIARGLAESGAAGPIGRAYGAYLARIGEQRVNAQVNASPTVPNGTDDRAGAAAGA
jgi:hypothetical protein